MSLIAARGAATSSAWTLDKIYEHFPIPKKRAKYKRTLLSRGKQQMLTIARALMINPKLILMDEPSEGLAPIMVKQIGEIHQLKQSSYSILLVEQNISLALNLADHAYIINKGAVCMNPARQHCAKIAPSKTNILA